MMQTDPISETCSFVFTEYQMMDEVQKPRNPENYKFVSSPFVESGTIIKISVCYTAEKQSRAAEYAFFCCSDPLASIFFPFDPVYAWLLPVDSGGHCTLFHELIKHKHMC
jgi:hypothetical protein